MGKLINSSTTNLPITHCSNNQAKPEKTENFHNRGEKKGTKALYTNILKVIYNKTIGVTKNIISI